MRSACHVPISTQIMSIFKDNIEPSHDKVSTRIFVRLPDSSLQLKISISPFLDLFRLVFRSLVSENLGICKRTVRRGGVGMTHHRLDLEIGQH